ncbi:MAG: hypothetical protein DI609_04280 [Corynebacterium urealyticum]|uniref:Uncharacterized protein n=1 Tax=Corynebacterium urealyticum TaxID=43771 RepID=A0A2W5B3F7_9CORY|nr:MAG: hypothetical protein DI609_04280 [Corynebacterium urealyticum]
MTRPATSDPYVTYFRTTLDPLDLYRLEQIINDREDVDTSTPASALAAYLVGLNPNLRLQVPGGGTELIPEFLSVSKLYMDAAVLSSGTNHNTIVGLQPMVSKDSRVINHGGRVLRVNTPLSRSNGLAWGTSLPTRDYDSSTAPVVYREPDTVRIFAERKEPVEYMGVTFLSSAIFGGYTNMEHELAPADVDGFVPVSWGSPTWERLYRPPVGTDMFSLVGTARSEDEYPAIVSCLRQGMNDHPLVNVDWK